MKKKIIISVLFFILFIGYLFFVYYDFDNIDNTNTINITTNKVITTNEYVEYIYVDISGEVNDPNVYKLPINSKLFELIELAGGLTENADIFNINRSITLNDGMKIIIPSLVEKENVLNNNPSNSDLICVELYGNIKNPSIYYVKRNTKLGEVILLAGGLIENNYNYLENIKNQVLNNDIKIEILYYEIIDNNINNNSSLININTASVEELDELPGIGKTVAQKIIEYRKIKPFNKIEDIKNVSGIGDSLFEKIKELIRV